MFSHRISKRSQYYSKGMFSLPVNKFGSESDLFFFSNVDSKPAHTKSCQDYFKCIHKFVTNQVWTSQQLTNQRILSYRVSYWRENRLKDYDSFTCKFTKD